MREYYDPTVLMISCWKFMHLGLFPQLDLDYLDFPREQPLDSRHIQHKILFYYVYYVLFLYMSMIL